MKYIVILFSVLLFSCTSSQRYTGQQYDDSIPFFFLSLAPSFDKPFEYEIQGETLIYREYSGSGGYDWGKRKVIAEVPITRKEIDKLDELALEAIADTIKFQQKRNESGVLEVVADGTGWYLQAGIAPFLSVSTNNPESKAFREILTLLNSILKIKPGNA